MDGAPVAADPAEPCAAPVSPPLSLRRPVKPIGVKDLVIAEPMGGGAVGFETVDPSSLLVDEAYQRALSERSKALIRKIVEGFDWRRFKPPIVARTEQGLEVIDGQHTAIAAASHPMIDKIPVFVVQADSREERAGAFIGHNRDRLGVTLTQLHHSAVAAGDPLALQVAEVCAQAGVTLLTNTPGNGLFKANETIAAGSIQSLVRRRETEFSVRVLSCLAASHRKPITAGQIKAVEYLLTDEAFRDDIEPEGVTEAFQTLGDRAEQEAGVFAAARGVPLWRALAVVIFKHGKKGRRRRSDAGGESSEAEGGK